MLHTISKELTWNQVLKSYSSLFRWFESLVKVYEWISEKKTTKIGLWLKQIKCKTKEKFCIQSNWQMHSLQSIFFSDLRINFTISLKQNDVSNQGPFVSSLHTSLNWLFVNVRSSFGVIRGRWLMRTIACVVIFSKIRLFL